MPFSDTHHWTCTEKGNCAARRRRETMPATIRDIKNRTGLSLATISKYLNGGNVLPKNKVLIEEAIEALHYEVNEIARGLVTNQTKLIGVMVYDIESFFSGSILHYISYEMRKRGYGVLICDSYNNEEVEKQNLKFLLGKKVDGILLLPVSLSGAFVRPAREAGVPVVLIDRSFTDEEYDFVGIDNHMTAYRAVNMLIENHHKKIAVITSDVEYTGMARLEGYRSAMYELGCCRLNGEGCEKDAKAAMRWFCKAGKLGHARAALRAGAGYASGKGVRRNYAKAEEYVRLALDRTEPKDSLYTEALTLLNTLLQAREQPEDPQPPEDTPEESTSGQAAKAPPPPKKPGVRRAAGTPAEKKAGAKKTGRAPDKKQPAETKPAKKKK